MTIQDKMTVKEGTFNPPINPTKIKNSVLDNFGEI
jgi:hypothetical protein